MTRRRSSLAIVAALAVTLAFVPVVEGPVRAASTFTFHGSGYGHGIGMSQWGAYGLAKMGWSHRRILTHFYRETRVERLDTLPVTIRVGLTSGRSLVHLRSTGGPVKLWEGRPSEGTPIGTIAPEETWTVTAKDGDHAVRDGSGALVGTRWGSSQEHLYVTFPGPGSGVFVPEADAIWSEGFTYTRGVLEFNLHGCGAGAGCAERLIAQVSLEEYLYGLGEVPASWPMESLEAQAVAARSYAVAGMRSGLRADCNCHLSDGAGDQVYVGADRELGLRGERWIRAVDATRSQVVTHEGAVVQAFYAASDGGHTEDVENVWHGGDDAYAIPWLRGVCDPGESTLANPWNDWTRSFDAATVTSRLATYTGSIGTIVSFGDVRRGTSGRILTAVANGASGSATVTGNEIQAALGLPDDRVWINADRSVTGPLRESYDGLMCAPGLPVSATSAVPGGTQQLFTDGGLYRNAALDLTLWLRGALDHEYRALGAAAGVLGLPVGDARALRTAGAGTTLVCEDCRRVDFAGGRIYLTDGIGARALWGRVLKTYLRARGIGGALGSPVTRVRRIPGGGAQAAFEGGRISCPLGAPCTVVLG